MKRADSGGNGFESEGNRKGSAENVIKTREGNGRDVRKTGRKNETDHSSTAYLSSKMRRII